MTTPGPNAVTAATAERGVAIGGDVRDSVIVTGDNVRISLGLGAPVGALLALLGFRRGPRKRARRTPLTPSLRPFTNHIDRESEAKAVLEGGLAVNLYGSAGVGKTHVLAHALSLPGGASSPDGAVYVFGKGRSRGDLLQAVFEEFYECTPPFKAGDQQIARDLAGKRALLAFDSAALERDDAQQLCAAAGGSRVVVASRERILFDGTALRLDGLAPGDALALVEQELGRSLTDKERGDAERICAELGGHPLSIRQAVSSGRPLAEVAARLGGGGASRLPELTLEQLSGPEQQVLRALAPFGDAPVGVEHLSAISESVDADATLAGLERRAVVESHSPSYSLAANLAGAVRDRVAAGDALDRALEYFSAWAEQAPYERQLNEAPALLELLRSAVGAGRHEGAIRLGRAIDAAFAWGRHFGAWGEVIQAVLDAAVGSNDPAAHAWGLHQRGTRAIARGEIAAGEDDLRRAEEIRTELGDEAGAAASRHNLQLAPRAVRPPGIRGHLPGGGWLLLLMVAAALTVALIVAGVGASVGLWDLPGGQTTAAAFTLTVAKEGNGVGSVTDDTGAIDCGAACTAEFSEGTTVELTAEPGKGSTFAGWQRDCDGTGSCRLTLDSDKGITAAFVATERRTVTVELVGDAEGTVTSSPEGIACPPTCTGAFARGATVTLTAEPKAEARFARWTGACRGTEPTCRVDLDESASVGAHFEIAARTAPIIVERSGTGEGSVTSEPAGIDCPAACEAEFPLGPVRLTATANEGSVFGGWSGAGCKGTEPCTVDLTAAATVQARFDRVDETHTLSVETAGNGKGAVKSEPSGIDCTPSCTTSFAADQVVVLTATAFAGSVLAGWSVEECGTKPTCELTMDQDRTVTATFNATPTQVLSVDVEPIGAGTLTSRPAGIQCNSRCEASFPQGSRVTLVWQAAAGFLFMGWGPAECPGTGHCTLSMSRARHVTAVFVRSVMLTAEPNGQGRIKITPGNVDCPQRCAQTYPQYTRVSLVATAAFGWAFSRWTGPCAGQGATCSLRLSRPTTVVAVFEQAPP